MKIVYTQIRLAIAEKLLSWAYRVAPNDEGDGEQIKGAILRHFKTVSK